MNKGKNIFVIILIALITIVLGFLIVVFINNRSLMKEDYAKEFVQMGSDTYSQYYYPMSIVDLSDIENYSYNTNNNDNIKTIERFLKKNKKCTKEDVKITVYPISPYTYDSFKIELDMACESK